MMAAAVGNADDPAKGENLTAPAWVAGVDGCRGGWLAVFRDIGAAEPPGIRLFDSFAEILAAPEAPRRIAVDMPIGLPDRIVGPGRIAEQAVRKLLGRRGCCVFSTPSRSTVEAAGQDSFTHAEASTIARSSSDPQRGISIQMFHILEKILEVDRALNKEKAGWVVETHPEVAFCVLAGASMKPKKQRSGVAQRRALLREHGFTEIFLSKRVPGAGADDLLDACVAALVAERLMRGEARPWPHPPGRDGRGLPIAIWA